MSEVHSRCGVLAALIYSFCGPIPRRPSTPIPGRYLDLVDEGLLPDGVFHLFADFSGYKFQQHEFDIVADILTGQLGN
jgi:hypothetical protein